MATVAAAGSPRAFAKRKLFMPRMDSCWYACKPTQQIHRSRRKIHYNKTDYDQSQLPKHARIINLKASRAEVLNKWVRLVRRR